MKLRLMTKYIRIKYDINWRFKITKRVAKNQVFEAELTIVQQYLLGIVEGYDRCIKLVECYEVDEGKTWLEQKKVENI